ncbi:MAG TPA: twin-arginine translocase subunit TatC, partial [Dictyobacter sp.]|nr:twin-arginine translocase subunit TatC [Dictyobacter sp.]
MATSDVDQQHLLNSGGYDPDQEEENASSMTLVEHLEELRWRIFKILIAVVVFSVVAFIFRVQIMNVLEAPLPSQANAAAAISGGEQKLTVTGLGEGFSVFLKVSVVAGIVLSLPVILYQVWAFVSPGLYTREKRYAIPFIIIGLILFVVGVCLGYVVLKYPVQWLVQFGSTNFTELVTAGSYFSFVSIFLLVFGVIFELPLVLTFLAKIGIVSRELLQQKRAVAHIGFWVAATVVTPGADLYSPIFIGVSL